MWHRVAPELAESHFVVVMDLRGYGWSSAPTSEGGAMYAKRAMYDDVITAMESLGHVRFHVAGHDRGARVAYRLALDHPGRVDRLALLDILPTVEVWKNIRAGITPGAHWDFLSRASPEPENMIVRDPDLYFESLLEKWTKAESLKPFDARATALYRAAWRDPSRIHAMCEDYRASAGIDLEHDRDSRARSEKIACDTLVLWGERGVVQRLFDPLALWQAQCAGAVTGWAMPAGHFIPEQLPEETAAALRSYMG